MIILIMATFFFTKIILIFRFWRGLYNRFETGVHPRDFLEDILRAKYHHIDQLRKHITFLEKVSIHF